MENKSNCIARCLLCITTVIIALMGFIYLIRKISPTYQNKDYWGLLITITIVGFILLTFSVCSLIHYYFREDATKKFDTIWDKIGSDITRIFSRLFSANGMFFLILFAIFVLLVIMIIKGISGNGLGSNESQFVAVTLSVALAALIPHIISKTIAENAVKPLINEQLEKYKPQLEKNRETALKNTAHSSRMTANILSQIADQQKRDADTLTDAEAEKLLYEKALENYSWAIGWGAKAIAQYFLIFEDYPEGISTFSTEIIEFLDELKQKIRKIREEFKELANKKVRYRDLKSVIQAHAFIRIHKDITFTNKDGLPINVEGILQDIELLLIEFGAKPNAEKCRMVELDYKGNNELIEKATVIIKEAKEAKKKAEEEEVKKKADEEAKKKAEEEEAKKKAEEEEAKKKAEEEEAKKKVEESLFQRITEWLRNHLCRKK